MNEIDIYIERYSETAYAAAFRLTGNQADAWDLVQEAFIRALEKAELYNPAFDFGNWLYRIIFRTYLNRRRAQGRRREVSLEPVSDEGDLSSAGPTAPPAECPAAIAESNDTRGRIASALGELSEEHRACLVLVDVEGRSYDEAADILDWPVGSVSGRVFRARRLLRSILENRGVRG
jgi:RNA polymerase sigma-70 factor (ECF subfamily)